MKEGAAVHGIHHVTCLAGDPQRNLDFYAGTLGLRLVKRSVNQDDPGTYHLFYADADGSPGTDITFFPRRGMAPGRKGAGQVGEVSFAVPADSLEWWRARLGEHGVTVSVETRRFGERVMTFEDPDTLHLAMVGIESERAFAPWRGSSVPAEHQIRGIHGVRIQERVLEPTARLLTQTMGFSRVAEEEGWRRYAASASGSEGDGSSGAGAGAGAGAGSGAGAGAGSGAACGAGYIELREAPEAPYSRWGAGTVHHVAWRVTDDGEQLSLRSAIEDEDLSPTPVIDRFWFRSVYFKEPGGTLFELATDGPGFARDEEPGKLGETLVLPPWLESHRVQIEAALPPLEVPATA